MSHYEDSFFAAVSALAGHGQIKERLVAAYEGSLRDIEIDDLPAAMRESFGELRRRLTSVAPLNGEGAIRASVRKMSVTDADRCAKLMVGLYADALRMSGNRQAALPLKVDEAPEVRGVMLKSV